MRNSKLYDVYDNEEQCYLAKSQTPKRISELIGVKPNNVRNYADTHAKYNRRYSIAHEGDSSIFERVMVRKNQFPAELKEEWDRVAGMFRKLKVRKCKAIR